MEKLMVGLRRFLCLCAVVLVLPAIAIAQSTQPAPPPAPPPTPITDWITAIANAVMAVGVGLVFWQAWLARKALEADHERSRRELAYNAVREYQNDLKPEHTAANRLVRSWTEEQYKCLADASSPLKIKAEEKGQVEACLGKSLSNPEIQGGFITLEIPEARGIRFNVISGLNILEIALAAWHLGVADRDTMVSQFRNVYDPQIGYDALERLRRILGTDDFPAIEAFVRELKEREEKNKMPKRKYIVK